MEYKVSIPFKSKGFSESISLKCECGAFIWIIHWWSTWAEIFRNKVGIRSKHRLAVFLSNSWWSPHTGPWKILMASKLKILFTSLKTEPVALWVLLLRFTLRIVGHKIVFRLFLFLLYIKCRWSLIISTGVICFSLKNPTTTK